MNKPELSAQAVFFDWDGTLVDTIPGVLAAHNHVRAHYGMELWSLEWFKVNMRQSALQLYPQIYGDNADAALDLLYGHIEAHHLETLQPLPGAAALLAALRERAVPMAVISNKKHKYLLREIDHIGWGDYFIAAVGAGVAARDKPDADPINKVLQDHGITAAQICYVGDTETDLLAARNVQCDAVLVLNGDNKDGLIQTYAPQLIVEDCTALHNYFYENGEGRAESPLQIQTC